MTNEIHPEDTLIVRKKFTDDKWYWQYKDPGVVGLDDKNDNGPYETRVKAIKAAYRFEKPKSTATDKEAVEWLLGAAALFLFVGSIAIFGFGYTLLAFAIVFIVLATRGIYVMKQKEADHGK